MVEDTLATREIDFKIIATLELTIVIIHFHFFLDDGNVQAIIFLYGEIFVSKNHLSFMIGLDSPPNILPITLTFDSHGYYYNTINGSLHLLSTMLYGIQLRL